MSLSLTPPSLPAPLRISRRWMISWRRRSLCLGTVAGALYIPDIQAGPSWVSLKYYPHESRLHPADTPGREREEDWQREAEDVQKSAALYRDTIDQALPAESSKRKAKSAKSHIFRKDKVAAE